MLSACAPVPVQVLLPACALVLVQVLLPACVPALVPGWVLTLVFVLVRILFLSLPAAGRLWESRGEERQMSGRPPISGRGQPGPSGHRRGIRRRAAAGRARYPDGGSRYSTAPPPPFAGLTQSTGTGSPARPAQACPAKPCRSRRRAVPRRPREPFSAEAGPGSGTTARRAPRPYPCRCYTVRPAGSERPERPVSGLTPLYGWSGDSRPGPAHPARRRRQWPHPARRIGPAGSIHPAERRRPTGSEAPNRQAAGQFLPVSPHTPDAGR